MGMHLAFVVPPAPGHVNPTLPLVEELVARGHRISYVTDAPVAPAVRAAGASVVETSFGIDLAAVLPSAETVAAHGSRAFDREFFIRFTTLLVARAGESFPALLAHFRQDPPDVVCHDSLSFEGPALADALAVPVVAMTPSMATNARVNPIATLPHPRSSDAAFGQVVAGLVGALTAFERQHGLRRPLPAPLPGRPGSPLTIVFVPREFQVAGEEFDDTYRFVGPALGSRAAAGRWKPPAGRTRVLFVSLGSTFNERPGFFARCVEAFRDSRWHVVMAVPAGVDLPPLPANIEVAPFFPQPDVLAHATVFVSHTGMNSTLESLYYGVPLVSVPQMPEQAMNGDRVAELGLGVRLDPDTLTAPRLREAVERVADDPVIRANVAGMSTRLRAADAAAGGADIIEKLVNGGRQGRVAG